MSSNEAVVISVSGMGAIAICRVTEGRLKQSATVKVMRYGKVTVSRPINTLSVDGEAVESVEAGKQCAVTISGVTFAANDVLKTSR